MTKANRFRAVRFESRFFSPRRVRALSRWIFLMFGLSLGVALAAPVVLGTAFQLVCSGAGAVHVLVKVDGDVHEMGDGQQMDCPLCLPGGAPPPALPLADPGPMLQPLGRILQFIPAARLAVMVAAPLPPRGPPEGT